MLKRGSTITEADIRKVLNVFFTVVSDEIAEGIFFFATDNTATQATVIASRTEGKIVFSVPALPVGSYTLESDKGYGTTNIVVRSGDAYCKFDSLFHNFFRDKPVSF